jgi:branched-chain amino acid transport system ATP-binding protein
MGLLEVDSISRSFGGVQAVQDFSMVQEEKQISGIIGPNGAGKTTTFNLISGVQKLDEGSITFLGEDITDDTAYRRTRKGLSRTFQNIRLFNNLSVLDNLKVAYGFKTRYNFWQQLLGTPAVHKIEKELDELANQYLIDFNLEKFRDYKPDNLSYGLRRKLELARALIVNPRLILLDEPAAGLNPQEIHMLIDSISEIQQERELSIILVEHHMELVMNICDRIHVLDFGKKIAEGTPDEIRNNDQVRNAYLGDEV